jgi:hypothetical protein
VPQHLPLPRRKGITALLPNTGAAIDHPSLGRGLCLVGEELPDQRSRGVPENGKGCSKLPHVPGGGSWSEFSRCWYSFILDPTPNTSVRAGIKRLNYWLSDVGGIRE